MIGSISDVTNIEEIFFWFPSPIFIENPFLPSTEEMSSLDSFVFELVFEEREISCFSNHFILMIFLEILLANLYNPNSHLFLRALWYKFTICEILTIN